MTSTAVTRQTTHAVATGEVFGLPPKQATLFEQARTQIEAYLPKGITFDSVMSDCFLATRKNQDLLKCDPESLVFAVIEVQQRGLRIGSTCHLVPKAGKVLAWNDYRGDIEMIVASGACRDVDAHVVYANEPFHYVEQLTGPELRHEVVFDAKDRGEMKGAYAKYYLGGNRYRVKYMPLADIEKIRANSLTWSPTSKTPVAKCPPWYAIKTVVRQGAKLLPKNRALLKVYEVFARDEQAGEIAEPLGATATMVRDDDGTALPVDTATGELVGADVTTPAAAAPERGTLEWARAFPLPWKSSDQFGKPIGDFSRDHLASIASWCENRMNAAAEQNKTMPPSTVDLYDATQLLLEDLDSQQATEEADIPALSATAPEQLEAAIVTGPVASPPGSLSHKMPKGGNIADAFPLDDLRGKPNRNALAEP